MLRDVGQSDNSISKLEIREVRKPEHLHGLDGIVLPGGESTVMAKLLGTSGLDIPLRRALKEGLPVFGTCAGLILLSSRYGILDCVVERNSYGTQINSFETELELLPTGQTCKAFFIRAPKIVSVGKQVEVIAKNGEDIVGIAQGCNLGITFHPEIARSSVFHRFFVAQICERLKSTSI